MILFAKKVIWTGVYYSNGTQETGWRTFYMGCYQQFYLLKGNFVESAMNRGRLRIVNWLGNCPFGTDFCFVPNADEMFVFLDLVWFI